MYVVFYVSAYTYIYMCAHYVQTRVLCMHMMAQLCRFVCLCADVRLHVYICVYIYTYIPLPSWLEFTSLVALETSPS